MKNNIFEMGLFERYSSTHFVMYKRELGGKAQRAKHSVTKNSNAILDSKRREKEEERKRRGRRGVPP
jgi:hypothetical protein